MTDHPSSGLPADQELRDLLGQARARIERDRAAQREKIAVVGMAARFPGAADLDAFWQLLETRRSGLETVTSDALEAAGVDPSVTEAEEYVPVWGGPPDTDGFDAEFFGYAPRDAEVMDPQQRMFLECAWHALEHAGYATGRGDRVGVYAGASIPGYLLRTVGQGDPFQLGLANIGGMVAARAAFHMDLRGPAVGVQTTCSSSLVALHNAIDALRRRDCDMALAGAVAVNQPRPEGYEWQSEGIASPDGTCRPFDADAAGTVFTNGAAVMTLKRLSDALADGDTIHAVLLGSAVNNDGADKISLTAPSVSGQADVVERALAASGIDAADIDFVEAHGTGTALGDPVELAALNRAMGGALEQAGRRCGIGSVKGNVGHLDAAAGMAGLLKLVLAIRNGYLPGTAHFHAPNPKCRFGAFDVLGEGRDWPRNPERPRRAGLSSFGIGGTNTHLVIEEPPLAPVDAPNNRPALLPLSAKTPEALDLLRENLAKVFEREDAPSLSDAAFTLQTGRADHRFRQAVTAGSRTDAIAALRAPAQIQEAMQKQPSVCFLFTGQGSQSPGMARALYQTETAFRAALDNCLAHAPDGLGDLLLNPDAPNADDIHQTANTQPALFAFGYALAQLWMARGVTPTALIGHSIGEYVAATLAGVLDLADAMRLVVARGALMQDCAPGAMLAVMLSEAEAANSLTEGVEIAAVNGPRSVGLAGPRAALERFAQRLERSGIGAQMLRTSHAFHSAAMDPAVSAFRDVVKTVTLRAPVLSMVSNLSGDWLTADQAQSPDYWADHLRKPVRFADGLSCLMQLDAPLLLEIGAGQGLTRAARQQMKEDGRAVASIPRPDGDPARHMLEAAGQVWAAGVKPDWTAFQSGKRRKVPLPLYPFERKSFWLPLRPADPAEGREVPPDRWFNQPVWRRLPAAPARVLGRLVVIGPEPLQNAFREEPNVVRVTPGDGFFQTEQGFTLDMEDPAQFSRLLNDLPKDELTFVLAARPTAALALAQALAQAGLAPRVALVGSGLARVIGNEPLDPDSAATLGLAAAFRQEVPSSAWRVVDAVGYSGLKEALTFDWQFTGPIALRGAHVWVNEHQETPLPECDTIEANGPVLITGDLANGLALAFAQGIRRDSAAPIVLAGRGLPAPEDWDGWLADHGADSPKGQVITAFRQLGRIGQDILVYAGDPGDPDWLESVLQASEARVGPVQGVFQTAAMGDESFCLLADAEGDRLESAVADKLRAIRALETVLAGRQARFCLVQSSLSVLAGGQGLALYAAANSALEAAVARISDTSATHWQTVQWDLAETGSIGAAAPVSSIRVLKATEVWAAAKAILAAPPVAQVAVTPGSLSRRLMAAAAPPAPQTDTAQGNRPTGTPFVAPSGRYEIAVAGVMGDMLGLSEVGANDNFFEMGGHSLLAIQIINRLRGDFQVELPVRALLYEAPTVAGIAGAIEAAVSAAEQKADTLDQLLDEVLETSGTPG